MIPIRDNIRSRHRPLMVYALIAANVACFAYEMTVAASLGESGFEEWLHRWALVPLEVMRHGGVDEAIPFLTSMFLHGGILHLGGNMLYLWVFGDNVEDHLGHVRFGAFYIACGLAAAGTQFLLEPRLAVPMLGASGAVAGVLGAYLVLFPGARVLTLVPIFILVYFVELPAIVFLGVWLLFQNVVPAYLLTRAGESAGGGVAYWAHIGGFAFGAAIAFAFRDWLRAQSSIQWRPSATRQVRWRG